MAGFTLDFAPTTRDFGRSGYNKDGDDATNKGNKSRAGFDANDVAFVNFGRSGYNKDGDENDGGKNKGRSGYNKTGNDDDDSQ